MTTSVPLRRNNLWQKPASGALLAAPFCGGGILAEAGHVRGGLEDA
jgi:hypothetical protein